MQTATFCNRSFRLTWSSGTLMLGLWVALQLASLAAHAQSSETTNLNGTWQFALAPNDAAADVLSGFYKVDFVPATFRPTPVPSNWVMQGYESPRYKPFDGEASQGFYLRHFTVPAGYTSKRVLLTFGGVWSSAEVWLNGKPLGRHDSGFTTFSYDVGALLKPGADNLLAVRVRQTQHDYMFDTNDDWCLPGIYRDVTLEAMPGERWIDRVDVQTSFDAQFRDADLKVKVMVGDRHRRVFVPGGVPFGPGGPPPLPPYDMRVSLLDAGGKTVLSQQLTIPTHLGTGRETSLTLHVPSPLQWTAETPNLYTLQVELLDAGKPSHERNVTVGFRQITTTGGVFRINGQAVKLRGVDRHDEYPDVGRATTPANWLQDITLMKAANINFIRTSHYPPAQGFLNLCDKMGMYVEDEVPMGYGGDNAADPSFTATVMLRSYETVERDINHPSIIMWSIGNEDPLTTLHMASIHTVKGLDPTRPVLMPWRAEEWLPEEIDILAPHYSTAQQFDDLAAHSTRPVMSSEYTHAYGTDGFGGLDARWKALTKHPAGTGGAIWMWADQGIKNTTDKPSLAAAGPAASPSVAVRAGAGAPAAFTPFGVNPFGPGDGAGVAPGGLILVDDGIDGIVGSYREPQRDFWETKAVYAQVFPVVDTISFTPGQPSIRVPIQNEFDFTDLKTIKIAWNLMEDEKQLASGTASIAGKPHSVASMDLPLAAIRTTRPGATYYAALTFTRPDGSELTKRSVELLDAGYLPEAVPRAPQQPKVTQGQHVTVQAGDAIYDFDPRTGQLASATIKGIKQISDLRPTIWHTLISTEANLAARDVGMKEAPDLNAFQPSATDWKVTEGKDAVHLHAAVNYKIDDKNSFSALYDYTITSEGTLDLHYSIVPVVQVHWLPQVGMGMELAPELNQLHWLGLGPLDAYPNLRAAPTLGVWGGAPGSVSVVGNKATRWIEADGPAAGLRIANDGYMRTESARPHHLEVLSAVVGRSSKQRRPETPEEQLNVTRDKAFVGEMSITLHP